ncbi:hypothetical protein ACSTD8_01710 [Vibrio vulnificus]|uniref:hypothetical protein n=1 Tax=Vibrio vulnificus TaxID=672 RepID=UPI0037681AC1
MKYFLINDKLVYSRAMLFSWESGSNPSSFSETNGEFISKKLEEVLNSTGKRIVIINANHVADVDDHFFNCLLELYKKIKFTLILYSSDKQHELINYFNEHLDRTIYNQVESYTSSDTRFFCLYSQNQKICSSKWASLKSSAEDLEKDQIKNLISSSYIKNENRTKLSSTPLVASGHFNANDLISNPYSFRWLVLLLVEMIYKKILDNQINSYTIVASSLRGAAIAGSVREILYFFSKPKLYVFDHIGPKYDFSKGNSTFDFSGTECCFYVGDFLIGGTELKLTQAYCQFFGGKITNAFTLGKYTNDDLIGNIQIQSIAQLKDCVEDLEYTLE